MDLKLRRLLLVRGFNSRQDDRVSGSLRTRPVPRTVPELCNALPVPPTIPLAPGMDFRQLRRTDGISHSSPRQATLHICTAARPPGTASHSNRSALDSRSGGPHMFRRIPILREPSRPFSLVLGALLVVISCAFAAEKDTTLSAAKRSQIEKAVSAFMTANSVPGVSEIGR